jgi:transglutaminase-like putative cysteine protease
VTASDSLIDQEENTSDLRNRLLRFLGSSWTTLALITSIMAIFASSVGNARWVPDSTPFTWCILLGTGFGALLASSRLRGWFAALYSLILSLAASGQAVGGVVLPPSVLGTMSFWDILRVMNVRILTFFERAGGWASAIASGAKVNDTGLFIFLIALIAWNASAWLLWSVVRQRRAINGLLPYGFLLGLNVYLSDQGMGNLLPFIACAVLLMSRTAFTHQSADWETRRVDTPYELGLEWGASTVAITIIIVFVALFAPLFGSPKGWNQLRETYLKFQNRTQKTAEQLFTGVTPIKAHEDTPRAETPVLSVIGRPLPNGQEIVMYVAISDPAPPPPELHAPTVVVKRHYWRNSIFTTYTGQGWQVGPTNDQPTQPLPAKPPPGRYALKQTYEILATHTTDLFSAAEPVTAGQDTSLHYTSPDNSSLLQSSMQGDTSDYEVTSWVADFTISQMRNAGTDYPPGITTPYLQLPKALPQRVRDLAKRIVGDALTPYDMAERIQDYLRITYAYKLDVPPPPAGRDAVDYFLFEAPGGFCTYYASAMAVMLRAEGVPARVVTGFAMGEYDYTHNAYRVTQSAAHAWVEVYFPGLGWVEFEPTSALDTFPRRNDSGTLVSILANQNGQGKGKGAVTAGVAFLILLLGLGGLAFFLMTQAARGRFEGGASPASSRQSTALYRQMRQALALAGLRAPSSATPDEFLAACAAPLKKRTYLRSALEQATALYRQAAFSSRPPGAEAVFYARRTWQRALPEWLLAALEHLVRPRKG